MKKFPAKFVLAERGENGISVCKVPRYTHSRWPARGLSNTWILVPTFTYIQRGKQTGNYLRRARREIRICFARIIPCVYAKANSSMSWRTVGGITASPFKPRREGTLAEGRIFMSEALSKNLNRLKSITKDEIRIPRWMVTAFEQIGRRTWIFMICKSSSDMGGYKGRIVVIVMAIAILIATKHNIS